VHKVHVFEDGPLSETSDSYKRTVAAKDRLVTSGGPEQPCSEVDSGRNHAQDPRLVFQETHTETASDHRGFGDGFCDLLQRTCRQTRVCMQE
jgi:hypothetical protein